MTESELSALYEGQLDAVLDAYKAIEAWADADALMRLRFTNPLRAAAPDPTDHACHGCAHDPTKHPEVIEDWHGKATQIL